MYNLFIRRYRRNLYFDTLEELQEELKSYFTQKEIGSGIIDRLTTFNIKYANDGIITNSYQDFECSMFID